MCAITRFCPGYGHLRALAADGARYPCGRVPALKGDCYHRAAGSWSSRARWSLAWACVGYAVMAAGCPAGAG